MDSGCSCRYTKAGIPRDLISARDEAVGPHVSRFKTRSRLWSRVRGPAWEGAAKLTPLHVEWQARARKKTRQNGQNGTNLRIETLGGTEAETRLSRATVTPSSNAGRASSDSRSLARTVVSWP